MGFQPEQGFALSFYDYGATVWTMNKRQNPNGAQGVEAPTEADVASHMAELENLGLVRTLH